MRKFIQFFTVVIIAFSASILSADIKPAVIYDMGGKFDKSFNESVYNGAQRFTKETGIKVMEFEVTNEDKNLTEKLCEPLGGKNKGFKFYLSKQTTDSLNAELIRLGQDKKIFFDITSPVSVSQAENNCPFFEAEVKFKTKYSVANRELAEGLLEPILIRLKSYMEIHISDKILKQVL